MNDMSRVANILRICANYIAGNISKEELILAIKQEVRHMEPKG